MPTKLQSALTWLTSAGRTSATQARADIGLGNVDNTSDVAKPISTATQTALDAKAPADLSGAAQQAVLKRLTPEMFGASGGATVLELSTTDESTEVSAPGATGSMVGRPIWGIGIPVGATVLAAVTGVSLTISLAATATGTIVGAVGRDDTAALQSLFFAAAEQRAEAYIPAGKVYLWSHVMLLRSHTTLRIHGTLLMRPGLARYGASDPLPFPDTGTNPPLNSSGAVDRTFAHLCLATESGWQFTNPVMDADKNPVVTSEDIHILGDGLGVIDGNVEAQDATFQTAPSTGFPHRAMDMYYVKNFTLSGMRIQRFTVFAMLMIGLRDFRITDNVIEQVNNTQRPGNNSRNQDGIHLGSNCVEGWVQRNVIRSGDDCIAVMQLGDGYTRDIWVTENVLEVDSYDPVNDYVSQARCVIVAYRRTGRTGMSVTGDWGIRNIHVKRNTMKGIGVAARLGLQEGNLADLGKISRVSFSDNDIEDMTYVKDASHWSGLERAVVYAHGLADSDISDNRVTSCKRGGFRLFGLLRCRVEANDFRDLLEPVGFATSTSGIGAIWVGSSTSPTTRATTSVRRASGVVTVETSGAHGLLTGDYVAVRGFYDDPSLIAPVAEITVTSTTAFTYSAAGPDIVGANADDTRGTIESLIAADMVDTKIAGNRARNIPYAFIHQPESWNLRRITWQRCEIVGNTVEGFGQAGSAVATNAYGTQSIFAGLVMHRLSECIIRDNVFAGGFAGYGIYLEKTRGRNRVAGNTVSDLAVGQNLAEAAGITVSHSVGLQVSSTSVRRVGGLVVAQVASHSYHDGDWVSIQGATTDTSLNVRLVQLTVVSSTRLIYAAAGADITSASGDDALLRISPVNLDAYISDSTIDNVASYGVRVVYTRDVQISSAQLTRWSAGATVSTGISYALLNANVTGLDTTDFRGSIRDCYVDCAGKDYGIGVYAAALPAAINGGQYAGSKIAFSDNTVLGAAVAEYGRTNTSGASGAVTVQRATAEPSTGYWQIGDRCELTAPTAGGAHLKVCTAAGTPGTWKSAGNLAA